jgi:hypothetical protein
VVAGGPLTNGDPKTKSQTGRASASPAYAVGAALSGSHHAGQPPEGSRLGPSVAVSRHCNAPV